MQITDSPTTVAPKSNRSAMMIVFLVVFIDLLGFGIVLPMLPRIAESHFKPIFPNNEPMVGFAVGMLMSSFSLMQFIFAPIWGRISDSVGRRPILLIGLTGSVIFYGLFGYATSLPSDTPSAAGTALFLFFAARIGAGIAGATISTAQAVIADCTPPERRKHGMALIGAAFGIGFTFGPLIGFGCLRFGDDMSLIGYSASALSLIALVLGAVLLRETRVVPQTAAAGESGIGAGEPGYRPAPDGVRRSWLDIAATNRALVDPAIGPVILAFFVASLGFGSFEVTLALFLKDNFGYSANDSFLIFAYIGFVLMLTQGFLYRRLASRLSEVTFMGLGIGFMAVGVGGLAWITYSVYVYHQTVDAPALAASVIGISATPTGDASLLTISDWLTPRPPGGTHLTMLFVALTASVIGFAFLTPSAQALISRRTAADRQGEILGVNQAASAMARILGPVIGVTLYKATESHLLPYIVGAVLLLFMLPLLPRIRRSGEV
jgi:DHA1 family tetracycline resistance protein-like MFS transporter